MECCRRSCRSTCVYITAISIVKDHLHLHLVYSHRDPEWGRDVELNVMCVDTLSANTPPSPVDEISVAESEVDGPSLVDDKLFPLLSTRVATR